MHEFVFFNTAITGVLSASILATSSAAIYGKGIFTTIAIYDGTPFLWEKHWRRLEYSASKLNIDLSAFSENTTRIALEEILKKNDVSMGRSRITFFDESASPLWQHHKALKTGLLITTGDIRKVSEEFRLTTSPYRINTLSPLRGIKSCNYLDKLMTLEEAKSVGFNEAIQINERHEVATAVIANVFWIKNDVLCTPSLKTGCLTGTTREFVMENLECREVEARVAELYSADAIFLTSAGFGVVQAGKFESRKLAIKEHPILNLLARRA